MISLVLPAYNPGPAVVDTWHALRRYVDRQREPWEILFVLDGCTDGTAERLQRLQTRLDSQFRILSYEQNRGKGYAVRTGLLAAQGDIRVFTDVDLAYGFDDILRVVEEIETGTAVAVASRTHPESQVHLPAKLLGYAYRRKLQSAVFGRVVRCLLPIHQTDTQAGLKGMTADAARHILPLLTCDGFGFDCELLTACHKARIDIQEVPVCVHYDDAASTTGSRTGLTMLREVWNIRRTWKHRAVPEYIPVRRVPVPTPVLKAA